MQISHDANAPLGPKPPEVNAVAEEEKPKGSKRAGAMSSPQAGGRFGAIREECRSLDEGFDHFRNSVARVPKTMELSDVMSWGTKSVVTDSDEACYAVEKTLDLSSASTDDGLTPLLDKIMLVNPGFTTIARLSDLGEDDFLTRDYQRPAG